MDCDYLFGIFKDTMVKRKEKDNDIPKTMQKTNDPTTRTPIKTGVNPGAPIGLADPDPIVTPVMYALAVVPVSIDTRLLPASTLFHCIIMMTISIILI
jgi:hypothetical protein